MYTIKRGVSIFISAEIERMLIEISRVYETFKIPLVITSGLDGPHRSDSLHYRFRAIDTRKIFPESEHSAAWMLHGTAIINTLRDRFKEKNLPIQIVVEYDHIHYEWDDKT